MTTTDSSDNLHIAILSSPGVGHLIPVQLLANRLATQHKVKTTVLAVTTAGAPSESGLLKLPTEEGLVETLELPLGDISHLINPSIQVVTRLRMMLREALPLIRSAIASMDRKPDALIVDLFGTEALPIALEYDLPKYVYVPSTAWFTALTVYCPVLDGEIKGQYVDQPGYLKIPGCKPVRPVDVVDPMLNRDDQQYVEYLRQGKEFTLFDGILLNSWEDLESETLQAFRENEALRYVMKNPVHPIGPLTRSIEPEALENEYIMDWLNKQPNQSVLFVSFGSGGVLSAEQITELAWGLELSQQRFVWVVRPPTAGHVDDAFFTRDHHGSESGAPGYLPAGFSTRTRNTGVLVPLWGQQVKILSHPSMGGFLSHCGWNSTLESIVNGVPMIAWPLYAEQRLNAAMLTEELGVALRPEELPTRKVVGREEIEKLARKLIQGEDGQVMRDKVKRLKISAATALSQINAGSSYESMCHVLSDVRINKKAPMSR
ncbi:anthocyanidin 3-O-glucosyltransferase 5-like [Henckelia pumila]|uniref:anthocyanidin 3-O-glucosyltransferase 5-like n=1 Tax=Henckelia pumila TaxID=405737 RepID=UPI003C6DD0AD